MAEAAAVPAAVEEPEGTEVGAPVAGAAAVDQAARAEQAVVVEDEPAAQGTQEVVPVARLEDHPVGAEAQA